MRFLYSSTDALPSSLMPRLAFVLQNGSYSVDVIGLLDTGAAVNVLPYGLGLALSAVWEEQKLTISLVGSLGRYEARGLAVLATHPLINPDKPVRLVCAWTKAENAPGLFGQSNFFLEFDISLKTGH